MIKFEIEESIKKQKHENIKARLGIDGVGNLYLNLDDITIIYITKNEGILHRMFLENNEIRWLKAHGIAIEENYIKED